MKLQLSCLLSHSSLGYSIIIINIFISILCVLFERDILILNVSSIFEICFVLYFLNFRLIRPIFHAHTEISAGIVALAKLNYGPFPN